MRESQWSFDKNFNPGEQNRRRLRLWVCFPLVLLILGLGLLSIVRPAIFYNRLHNRPLKEGESPIALGLDLAGGARVLYKAINEEKLPAAAFHAELDKVAEQLHQRIASYGNLEPNISVDHGRELIVVELPGVDDREAIASLIGETGKLVFTSISAEAAERLRPGMKLPREDALGTLATRRDIVDVAVERLPGSGERGFVITFAQNLATEIQGRFAEHAGETVAITISGRIYHIVQIGEDYTGGEGQSVITTKGGMSQQQADSYERLFQWQALPLDLEQKESQFVSAEMGEEQLIAAYAALALGGVLVVLLMLVLYGTFLGVIGIISLAYCGVLVLGTLNATGTVLSLSGMAGLLLTLGISVDSFILIFEGIKDEIRRRVKLDLEPFDEEAIWDEIGRVVTRLVTLRLTTAAGAAVLLFAEGPIRGFAETLLIGLAVEWIVASRPILGGILIALLKHGTTVSRWTYGLPAFQGPRFEQIFRRVLARSGQISVASIATMTVLAALLFFRPPDQGLDFAGGAQVRVVLPNEVGPASVESIIDAERLSPLLLSMQKGILGASEDAVTWILSFRPSTRTAADIGDQLVAALENAGIQASVTGTWDIGPRIPIERLVAWAGYTLLALLAILLICLMPWSGISICGARAVPALTTVTIALHDVLFAAGLAALLRFEIDLPTIVGLLVVLGYSVNDSLVLLWHLSDKRRPEVTPTMHPEAVDEVILGIRNRTMNTSLTTLAAVVPVILFAGRSFQGYALVVVTGIVVGTISSIFLLGQMMKLFIGRQADHGTELGMKVPVQI